MRRLHYDDTPVRRYRREILLRQIEDFAPDVLFVFSHAVDARLLTEARSRVKRLVGQWGCALEAGEPYGLYDLIITCAKPLVAEFAKMGIPAVHLPHAFDVRVLHQLRDEADLPRAGVAFVGKLERPHRRRFEFLQRLSELANFECYGPILDPTLPKDSPLHRCYRGPAVGLDLYRVYRRSKIVWHLHEDVGGRYVGAKRLFEASGMGAMLLTDVCLDLHEYFEPGKEVVTFEDVDDCAAKIRYYLEHDEERAAIAEQGRSRTLAQHSLQSRTKELLAILSDHLSL